MWLLNPGLYEVDLRESLPAVWDLNDQPKMTSGAKCESRVLRFNSVFDSEVCRTCINTWDGGVELDQSELSAVLHNTR